jgi:hypothetical protein
MASKRNRAYRETRVTDYGTAKRQLTVLDGRELRHRRVSFDTRKTADCGECLEIQAANTALRCALGNLDRVDPRSARDALTFIEHAQDSLNDFVNGAQPEEQREARCAEVIQFPQAVQASDGKTAA